MWTTPGRVVRDVEVGSSNLPHPDQGQVQVTGSSLFVTTTASATGGPRPAGAIAGPGFSGAPVAPVQRHSHGLPGAGSVALLLHLRNVRTEDPSRRVVADEQDLDDLLGGET